jgi:hypothetical protein
MEVLEGMVLPVVLVAVLLLAAIWTSTLIGWLRSTEPLH